MKAYTRFDIYSTWKISNHYLTERGNRHVDIIMDSNNLGYGSYIVLEVPRNDGRVEYLTNTGILLVVEIAKNELTTAYAPHMDKVFAMYNSNGIAKVPHWMVEKVAMWESARKKEADRIKQMEQNMAKLLRNKEFEEYKKNRYKRG